MRLLSGPKMIANMTMKYVTNLFSNVVAMMLFCIHSGLMSLCLIIMLLAASGVEQNPGPGNGNHGIDVLAHGTFHQANMHMNKHGFAHCKCIPHSYTAGVQCVTNSIVATTFAQFKPIDTWNTSDLDFVLCSGDALYKTISSKPELLAMDDIPKQITVWSRQFGVSCDEDMSSASQCGEIQPLLDKMTVQRSTDGVFMLGDQHGAYACSVHYRSGKFYIFNPHAASTTLGFPDPNGVSVLISCQDAESCAMFVNKLASCVNYAQFTLTMVNVRTLQCYTDKHQKKRQKDTCNFCNFVCDKAYNLVRHELSCAQKPQGKRKQATQKTFQCSFCGKTFNNDHNLITHERLCAQKQKKIPTKLLQCSSCTRSFGNQYNKETHEKHCRQKTQKNLPTEKKLHCVQKSEATKSLETKGMAARLSHQKTIESSLSIQVSSLESDIKRTQQRLKEQYTRKTNTDKNMRRCQDEHRHQMFEEEFANIGKNIRTLEDTLSKQQTEKNDLTARHQRTQSEVTKTNESFTKNAKLMHEKWTDVDQEETEKTQNKESNSQHIECKVEQKHKKMSDLKHNDRKVEQMRQKRSHTEYKQREAEQMRQKRSNTEYKQREAEQMSQKRSDTEYKEREAEQMRQKRSATEYKQQEAKHMRQIRSDTQYKDREAEQKRQKRCDTKYKERETEQKRQKRCDTKYKEREAEQKRQKRCDTKYKEREAEQKRQKRSEIEHKEREAEYIRQKWSDPQFKDREAEQKRDKRANIEHRKKENVRRKEMRTISQHGKDLAEAIQTFHSQMAQGPVYICGACLQTEFEHKMFLVQTLVPGKNMELLVKCLSAHIVLSGEDWKVIHCTTRTPHNTSNIDVCDEHMSIDGKLWICRTCKTDIYKGLIPKLSTANLVGFPEQPDVLKLHWQEEMLIAPILAMMVIRALPVCGQTEFGQKKIVGNVVHVPNDIASTAKQLPRSLDNMGTIGVKVKRKKEYKHDYFVANIRPMVILQALAYLRENSSMFREYADIGSTWLEDLEMSTHDNKLFVEGYNPPSDDENDQPEENCDDTVDKDTEPNSAGEDVFEEIDASEQTQGNMDTMVTEELPISLVAELGEHQSAVEESEKILTLAPGEGKIPVYREPLAEYLAFPTIFCGTKRPTNAQRHRPVTFAEICKAELKHKNSRVWSSTANMFWKDKCLQHQQFAGTCSFALRRMQGPKKRQYTAADLRNAEKREKIKLIDDGYMIFRHLRNTPPYYDHAKKKAWAMIRQLGYPTIFFSLSAADTNWTPLLRTLGWLVDGKVYSDDYIANEMTFDHKNQLVRAHPTACSRYFNERVQVFLKTILLTDHSPFHCATDYMYRVEFQHRGSPHIHGLLWIDDAPKPGVNTKEEIIKYIDSCISCSLDVSEEDQKYVKFQVHKHSRSCAKMVAGKKTCRFGMPVFPMRSTQILDPLLPEEVPHLEVVKERRAVIQEHLRKIPDDVQTFDDWLQFINLSEEDYIMAIRVGLVRPKIYLQRRPTEVRVNAYMKHLVGVWQANHDVQFVLDAYQCVTYICDYMTKSQRGMSDLMHSACEHTKAGNMAVKESLRYMSNVFLNAVEASIQECVFEILSILHFVQSSVKDQFISTAPADERATVMKTLDELEQLKPDSKDVTYKTIIDRYTMRPKKLLNWCLAEYVAWIDIEYPGKKPWSHGCVDSDSDDSDNSDGEEDGDESSVSDDIFPYTMRSGITLRKRKRRKIIRFVNYRLKTNPEEYYRERLMLYTAWTDEDKLKGEFATYQEAFEHHKETICANMAVYEHVPDEVLEKAQAEYDEENVAENSNAIEGSENDEILCQRVSPEEQFDIGPSIGLAPICQEPEVALRPKFVSDHEFYALVETLNRKQQEFYTHVMHQAMQGDEQVLCALHGGAGTGKSRVVKVMYQGLQRILNKCAGETFDADRILLAAPTGKAAYNIQGTTIHRAFHIAANQRMEHKPLTCDLLNTARKQFHHIQWILLDEFSMVGNKMLKFIYLRLQEIKGNKKPFGGVNIVCVGDLYQLQPVMQDFIFVQPSDAYNVLATNLFIAHFTMFELDEIMHQKDDKTFAELLNRLRTGEHTKEDIQLLRTRQITEASSQEMSGIPHFFPTCRQRDLYNDTIMNKSVGHTVHISAIDAAPSDLSNAVQQQVLEAAKNKTNVSSTGNLPYTLMVKVGQLYDVTANIAVEDGIINGAECVIQYIEPSQHPTFPRCVWVKFTDSQIGVERRRTCDPKYRKFTAQQWTPIESVRRTFIVKRSQTVTRRQFPLRHAAGRTIHVAQSSTYQKISVNMATESNPPKKFWEHMHYVAFSRCTSLSGLNIVDINEARICVSAKVKDYLANRKRMMSLCYEPSYAVSADIKIAFNNVCSLHHKWGVISRNELIIHADVIILAETWLSPQVSRTMYHLENFDQRRMDSVTKPSRRGLLTFLPSEAECVMSQTEHLETSLLRVETTAGDFQIVGLYKAPTTTLEHLCQELSSLLDKCNLRVPTIVIGDFNLNALTNSAKTFIAFMQRTYNMHQCVTEPTTHEGTAIDLVFTNVQHLRAFPVMNSWSSHHTVMAYVPKIDT